MAAENTSIRGRIPEQSPIPWLIAFEVSLAGLKRRFLRSLVTMSGVVLAIAFLGYMLVTDRITKALVDVRDADLNVILQQQGVDIFSETGTDALMLLLIGLARITCTVGIVNSMLMAVTERVREIGTLKCLGARDQFIIKSYFIESALQGICGAVIGMFLGVFVAMAATFVNYGGYVISYCPWLRIGSAMLICFLSGAAISILASIAPAYMAARKQPVDALRVEE